MAVLKSLSALFCWLLACATTPHVHAESPYNEPAPAAKTEAAVKIREEMANPLLCRGTQEYIDTLEYFRKNKEFVIKESAARKIAERVSRGCNGATERFIRVLVLLRNVGVSDLKALEMSLDFAGRPPDVQKNFTEIFTRAYLNEFFDYDYGFAAKLAYELSKDYQGDPKQVRKDFIELVRFCKDKKNLDLPAKLCAELTIKLARLSQYYPDGVSGDFLRIYKELRSRRDFGLDVKASINVAYNVLKNGPTAFENFFSAYNYAMDKDGLDLTKHQGIEFALLMAERSFVGDSPPVVPIKKEIVPTHDLAGQ